MTSTNDNRSPKHYAAEYQHWDMALDVGMGYLESAATKYIARWRQKDGIKDLKKALHYLDKRINDPRSVNKVDDAAGIPFVIKFCQEHRLGRQETGLMVLICLRQNINQLKNARRNLLMLIHDAEAEAGAVSDVDMNKIIGGPDTYFKGGPVPLTEENHYAERAEKDKKDE